MNKLTFKKILGVLLLSVPLIAILKLFVAEWSTFVSMIILFGVAYGCIRICEKVLFDKEDEGK